MAPDVEELIKRVNTLTLDKNRLKQKLTQLTNNTNNGSNNGHQRSSALDASDILKQLSSSFDSPADLINLNSSNSDNTPSGIATTSPSRGSPSDSNAINKSTSTTTSTTPTKLKEISNIIAGVQCTTSCEDDLIYVNNLYKSRLEEYQENWDFIQSKCTALLSELNALQKHFAILKREKLELEDKLRSKCDEHERVTSELQTVALNYELQLSAMSEHLSMITSQVNLGDTNS